MASAAISRPSPANNKVATSKDLWQQICDERVASNESNAELAASQAQREATLLFLGPSQSGKSSLIQSYMFKDRDEVPRPTSSLDYRYTRTSLKDSMNEEKSLSHFWELGGGSLLIDLIDISVSEKSLKHVLCLIVVDCSRTSALVQDATNYLNKLRRKADSLLSTLKSNGSPIPAQLQTQQRRRFGESHPDMSVAIIERAMHRILFINR